MTVSVVIPARNEAPSIGTVVSELPRDRIREVIVVDNASSDATAQAATAAGAVVLREERAGYGWACLRGIEHLSSNPPDVIAFLDGDLADFPEELSEVVRPILEGRADLVIGSRIIGRREPGSVLPQALMGNRFACWLIYVLSGVRFTDLGPFRAIRYRELVALQMQEMRYGWTVEMQIKAVEAGLRCTEVPVSYRKRTGKSKVTGTLSGTVKASARILWLLARYAVRRLARRPINLLSAT